MGIQNALTSAFWTDFLFFFLYIFINFSKLGKFLLELDFHTLILNGNFFVGE